MFNHIIVPLDGSKFAETAIEPAISIADKFGGKVTLISVAITPPMQIAYSIRGLPDASNLYLSLRQNEYNKTRSYLDSLIEKWKNATVIINGNPVIGAPIADAILSGADTLGGDLIVMTSHGRSGLSRWMLGSVAEQLVRKATIPVYLLRPETVLQPEKA